MPVARRRSFFSTSHFWELFFGAAPEQTTITLLRHAVKLTRKEDEHIRDLFREDKRFFFFTKNAIASILFHGENDATSKSNASVRRN